MNTIPILAAAPGCPVPNAYHRVILGYLQVECAELANWHQTHVPRGWLPVICEMMTALKHVHSAQAGDPPLITLLRAEGGSLRVDHNPCSKAAVAVIRELQDRVRGVCQNCGWPCDEPIPLKEVGHCPVCAYLQNK